MPNNQKTLLPFISSQQPDLIIKDETEKAGVFCLAEIDRKKGGGLFRKQEPEKIVFAAETFYPFWIVPFRNLTLLFDGLNLTSRTMSYPSFADTKNFMDNLRQRSSTRQIYATFLSNHIDYFQESNGEQSKIVEGLISDLDFLEEFIEYSKSAVMTYTAAGSVLISPAQEKNQIKENLKDLDSLHQKLSHDIEEFNEVIKALSNQSQRALSALREEIKAVEKEFEPQIEDAKVVLSEKRFNINKEYSDKVTQVSGKFEQELIAIRKEVIKLQKTSEQTNSEIAEAENAIKTAVVNKDEDAEQIWKEKRNQLKKHLSETNDAIKNLDPKIREIEENKKEALFKLKQQNDVFLKESAKDLMEIESSRDAEIKTRRDEMEKIEDLSSLITSKIDKLAKISEAALAEFEKLGVQYETAGIMLVYMPFYLICYQSGQNKRCISIPPSVVSNSSISVRLKTLGKCKITQLFQPRSQKIVSILNGFLSLLDENVAFNREIREACTKASILGSKERIESIRNGLSQLSKMDFLSNSEFEYFSKTLP